MRNCHVYLTQSDTVSVSTVRNNNQDNDIALVSQDAVEGAIFKKCPQPQTRILWECIQVCRCASPDTHFPESRIALGTDRTCCRLELRTSHIVSSTGKQAELLFNYVPRHLQVPGAKLR
jgi:hypothetical protein